MQGKFYVLIILFLLSEMAHGQSWSALKGPSGGTVTDLEYDAVNGKVYAIVNYNIFVSSNNGTSWTQLTLPVNYLCEDMFIDGSTLVGIFNSNQIFTSSDAGVTWTGTENSSQLKRAIRKLPQAGAIAAFSESSVSITLDGGATWKKILTVPDSPYSPVVDMKVAANGDIFIINSSIGIRKLPFPSSPAVLANWDEANWITVVPSDETSVIGDGSMKMLITPSDKIFISRFSIAAARTVFESSTDYGVSWQPLPMTGYIGNSFVSRPIWSRSPNGKIYLFDNSSSKQVWEYTDGAPTPWVAKSFPLSIVGNQDATAVIWTSSIQAFAGGGPDGIYRTSNTAASWSSFSTGINFASGRQIISMQSGRVLYVQGTYPNGYYYSDNAGTPSEFWTFQSFPYPIKQLFKLPDNTLLINGGGYTHTSADGLAWSSSTSVSYDFNDIVIVAANDMYGFTNDGNIWSSLNKGITWSSVTVTGLTVNGQFIDAERDDDGYFYAYRPKYPVYPATGPAVDQFWKINSTVSPWEATQIINPPFTRGGFYTLNNKIYCMGFVSTDKAVTWKYLGVSGEAIPLKQGTGGIAIASAGNLSITQDDGKTFRNISLPTPEAVITSIAMDGAGDFLASALYSPALKFTDDLVLAAGSLPPFIDFNWQALSGGPFGGRMERVLKNSVNDIFAIGGIRLYKYNPGTVEWQRLPVSSVNDVTFGVADKIYVVTNVGELHTSSDNGTSFSKVSSFASSQFRIFRNTNGDLLTGSGSGILRSVNDGVSFTSVATGNVREITGSTNGTLIAINSSANTLLRSIDNGATWTSSAAGISLPGGVTLSTVNALDAGKLVVVTSDNIYRSTDNAATWTSILGNLTEQSLTPSSRVKLTPAGELSFSGNNAFYISANMGVTWTKKTPQDVQNSGKFSFTDFVWNGSSLYAGTSASGVIRSTDNGANFTSITMGLTHVDLRHLRLIGDVLYAVDLTRRMVIKSTDLGVNWIDVPVNNAQILGLQTNAAGDIIAFGTGVYKSSDAGATWTTMNASVYFGEMSTADGLSFYGYTGSGLSFSTDLKTWVPVPGYPNITSITSMSNDTNGNVFLCYKSSFVYKVAFGVSTKLDFTSTPGNVTYKNGKTYIYDYLNGIYESGNGATWTKKTAPRLTALTIANLNYFFITGSGGEVWVSRDQGVSWQNVGSSDASLIFTEVVVNEFNGFAYALVSNNRIHKSAAVVIPPDTTKPLQAILTPSDNASDIPLNVKLSFSFNEAAFPVSGKKLRLFIQGSPAIIAELDASSGIRTNKIFTFTLPTPLNYSIQYYATLDAGSYTDIFGNASDGVTTNTAWNFTTKAVPVVNSVSPANNATNILLNTPLRIVFSEAVTGAVGKNAGVYTVASPASPVMTFSARTPGVVSNDTLNFALPSLLEYQTQYFVKFDNDAFTSDEGGVVPVLNTDNVWKFTTGNAPTISVLVPAQNAANLPLATTSLKITFSEPLTGAAGKNLVLYKATSPTTPVVTLPATSGVATGSILTYTLSSPLEYETQYFIKFDTKSFVSAIGAPVSLLTTNTDWVFTTLPAPDIIPPNITFTTVDKEAVVTQSFVINATDNKGIATDKGKIFYRSLDSKNAFIELAMTSSGTGTAVSFSREISNEWYGDVGGIEIYFQVTDLAGLTKRSPLGVDTYHYSYLKSFSGAATPVLTGLPPGGTLTTYRIISIPYELADKKIETIFKDELGNQDPKTWRLLTYGSGDPAIWLEYPKDFTTFERGKGYWINVKNQTQLSIDGASSPKNNSTDFFSMQLKSGWNEIGNPYAIPISWEETRLQSPAIGKLKIYKGGSTYENGDELKKFEGGFVFVTGADINVKVRYKGITSGGRVGESSPNRDISKQEWLLPIVLKQGDQTNTLAGIGMHPGARTSFDQYDDITPPGFFRKFDISFTHPESTQKRLTIDMVPSQNEYTWKFNVDSDLDGAAELQWDVASHSSKELYLFDVSLQRLVNMTAQSHYVFNPNESSAFRIYFGENLEEKIKPDFASLLEPYPNPSSGKVSIPFTIPDGKDSFDVRLEMFDMVGRKISTLENGNFKPGFYKSLWDAADHAIGNGMYFYKLTVSDGVEKQGQVKKIVISE